MVELNQAVAVAESGDVDGALRIVERLDLDGYHYLHATRAELLRRLDRVDDARGAYGRALELVHSDAERRLLERRLAELGNERRDLTLEPIGRVESPLADRRRGAEAGVRGRAGRVARASSRAWWRRSTGSSPARA